jgi:hypothetical protein
MANDFVGILRNLYTAVFERRPATTNRTLRKTTAIRDTITISEARAAATLEPVIGDPVYSAYNFGPSSFWRMEEASGTRYDAIGANDLTDGGTTTQAAGKIGNAGQFVRTDNDYLYVASNASLLVGDIDFSGWAWVYLDTSPTVGQVFGIMGKYLPTGNQRAWAVTLVVSGGNVTWRLSISPNGATVAQLLETTHTNPSTGAWHFVVWWHDSVNNTINIQVDGGTVDSLAHTTGVHTDDGTANFEIGRFGQGGNHFDGRIDAVGFGKFVPTAAQRAILYNAGAGIEFVAPRYHYGECEYSG